MNQSNPLNQILAFLTNVPNDVNIFWNIIGAMLVFAFVMYALFAFLIIRQVFMMTKTFETTAEPVLKILSFIHFAFAVVLIFFAYSIIF